MCPHPTVLYDFVIKKSGKYDKKCPCLFLVYNIIVSRFCYCFPNHWSTITVSSFLELLPKPASFYILNKRGYPHDFKCFFSLVKVVDLSLGSSRNLCLVNILSCMQAFFSKASLLSVNFSYNNCLFSKASLLLVNFSYNHFLSKCQRFEENVSLNIFLKEKRLTDCSMY